MVRPSSKFFRKFICFGSMETPWQVENPIQSSPFYYMIFLLIVTFLRCLFSDKVVPSTCLASAWVSAEARRGKAGRQLNSAIPKVGALTLTFGQCSEQRRQHQGSWTKNCTGTESEVRYELLNTLSSLSKVYHSYNTDRHVCIKINHPLHRS